jgi:hypothetical protein
LIDYCATQVTDEQLAGAAVEFPYNPPTIKSYFYRSIFNKYIRRQLLLKQLENGFQNGKKIWIKWKSKFGTHASRY